MQDFAKQLKKIENKFMAEVKNSGYKYDDGSYSIDIGNGILYQRIECFDENDDTVVLKQEIEQDGDKLFALGVHYEY